MTDARAAVHIPADLRAAYAKAHYICTPADGAPFTLMVGQTVQAGLAGLPAGYARLAVVTAHNPFSRPLPDAENTRRNAALWADMHTLGYAPLPALGRDPADGGHAEESFLVINPSDHDLDRWMRDYGQNAVAVGAVGQPFALRFHPDAVDAMGGINPPP